MAGVPRRSPPHAAYIVRIAASPGELLFYGVRHTSDPRDPQIAEIERLWREFRPELAFSEGGIRPKSASRDEAIRHHGEPGLLRVLADSARVPLRDLEPPSHEEAAALARDFPPEQVKLFYLLRYVADYSSAREQPIEDYAEGTLKLVRHRWKLEGPPGSIEEVQALAKRCLPQLADWRAVPRDWFSPVRNDTFLNELARRSGRYRDCHMAPLIAAAVRSGKRVFVLAGSGHAIMQERALRSALERR